MPQGDAPSGGAPKASYARKRSPEELKRGGAGVNKDASMALQNPAFKAGLGKMITDIEAITAAKLVKSGAAVHLGDIKRAGAGEIFNGVNVFTPGVVTLPGITLSVFIGEDCSLRFTHGGVGVIL